MVLTCLGLAFIEYIQMCTHLSIYYLMDSFTFSPGAKRLLLYWPSYVTQHESKGRLETDEQVENPIGMYASSKQNKLMVHLGNQQKSRQRNKNNGIIIMGSCFIIIIDLISKDHLGALQQFTKKQKQKQKSKCIVKSSGKCLKCVKHIQS